MTLVLWTDASLDETTGRGGLAVVREDGTAERMLSVVEPVKSIVGLERQAVLEALAIAAQLVDDGEAGPIEIRTDCKNAAAGVTVRRAISGRVRVVWAPRNGNAAHALAYRAARV